MKMLYALCVFAACAAFCGCCKAEQAKTEITASPAPEQDVFDAMIGERVYGLSQGTFAEKMTAFVHSVVTNRLEVSDGKIIASKGTNVVYRSVPMRVEEKRAVCGCGGTLVYRPYCVTLSVPTSSRHKCEKCGAVFELERPYPFISYEEDREEIERRQKVEEWFNSLRDSMKGGNPYGFSLMR